MPVCRPKAALTFVMLVPLSAWAQSTPSSQSGTLPELPNFPPPVRTPGAILPSVPLPPGAGVDGLFSGVRIFVADIRIVGNTVLAADELDRIVAPYRKKELSFADLERLRDQLTAAYIHHGYVSSGAVIPDQTIHDGVVEIRIVQGTLGELEVKIKGRLRKGYVSKRLRLDPSRVVNVGEVEGALQILRQDPRIRGLDAELVPGETRGQSVLRVSALEAAPEQVVLRLDNQQPVSVGSAGGSLEFTDLNLSGLGDTFSASFRGTHGLRFLDGAYTLPLGWGDTALTFHLGRAWSEVVEKPFDSLDIKSSMETYGLTLQRPVYRTLRSAVDVFVTGEVRRSQSFLLGSGFQFTADMTENGVARASVVRFGQNWTKREIRQAMWLRNTLSVGLGIFGATVHEGNVADSRFVAWLGQFQWARRVHALRSGQVIVRGDAQLTNSPLLGMEKLVLGGEATVRGYRENEMVRDNGLIGSVEARIPIVARGDAPALLALAPFVDVGRGWDAAGGLNDAQTLPSAGVGLRWRIGKKAEAELYWGHAFRDLVRPGPWNPQDSGIHVGFSWSLR